MNANELVSRMSETHQVTFSFGKNGWGLSDEFIFIGNRIKDLSQDYNIYLKDATIDTLDDVYDLVFEIHPNNEPLTVTESSFSVESLEDRITNLMEENKQLRKEINCLTTPKQKSI